jgi:phospholipid/cholesterol/gamma-HCH transport system substrate-binding protein
METPNYVGAVAKPMEGLAADYQLLIDLRSFQITGAPAAPTAHVEFAAKILGEAGRIVGSRTFDAVVPARDVSAAGAAAALNEAFGKAVTGLVEWTAGVI